MFGGALVWPASSFQLSWQCRRARRPHQAARIGGLPSWGHSWTEGTVPGMVAGSKQMATPTQQNILAPGAVSWNGSLLDSVRAVAVLCLSFAVSLKRVSVCFPIVWPLYPVRDPREFLVGSASVFARACSL